MKKLVFLACLLVAAPLWAQGQPRSVQVSWPSLTGAQKSVLVQIAREAIVATLENRESRAATVEPRLKQPQPLAISVYVDGRLRGRAWRLKTAAPLFENVRDVTYEAIDEPKTGGEMLSLEELSRAEVAVAVLGSYTKAVSDQDIPPRSAVVIYNGFTEWLALPGDVDSDSTADLLRHGCEEAGLRPNVWLLPQTTLFWAEVDQAREKKPEIPTGPEVE